MPRPHPRKGLARGPLGARARAGTRRSLKALGRGTPTRGTVPSLRRTAAVFTSLTALAATSLIAAPSVAVPLSAACALKRTGAHHSEGVDTWNASYPRPIRPLDALVVFLSFPDATPRITPAELTADHFPATSRFFERASYGKFTLRAHPRSDWIEMPRLSTDYAIERDWDAAHRAAYLRDAMSVVDGRVDFSAYDIVYFVADPDAPGVDSDATKVVNLDTPLRADGTSIHRVVTVFENHPPDRLVLAHETGHVFDLPDLYHRPTDGEGDWDTYVGDWDLMGSQFGLAPDLFAWHKWKLGWLEPHQVACVRGSGTTRLTLEPLSAGPARDGAVAAGAQAVPAGGQDLAAWELWAGDEGFEVAEPVPFGSGRGTKLAVVRTGWESALAFEARGPVGNDDSVCSQGILIYRIRSGAESGGGPMEVVDAHPRTESCGEESVYPPLADAPVGEGESFTVPGGNVRVQVEDRTPSGAWTVAITVLS